MKVGRSRLDPLGCLRGLRHSADAFLLREIDGDVDVFRHPVGDDTLTTVGKAGDRVDCQPVGTA